jgi:autotransporter adhesin
MANHHVKHVYLSDGESTFTTNNVSVITHSESIKSVKTIKSSGCNIGVSANLSRFCVNMRMEKTA